MPAVEQVLIQRLGQLDDALARLRTALPTANDARLRRQFETVIDASAALLQQQGQEPGPAVADELDRLLSGVNRLANLADDPELGPLLSREDLEAGVGLVMLRTQNALNAAKDLGWLPTAPELPARMATEVGRDEIAGALPHIVARLDAMSRVLDDLVQARDADNNHFPQQRALVNFYAGSMRVEINLARMSLSLGETRLDISALWRASEVMAELTGDFVATVRAWTGRVATRIAEVAEQARQGVRKVVRGLSTAIKLVVRRSARVGERTEPAPPLAQRRSNVSLETLTFEGHGTVGPPPDFSQEAAERMYEAAELPPTSWWPFVHSISFANSKIIAGLAPLGKLIRLHQLNLSGAEVSFREPLLESDTLITRWVVFEKLSDVTPLGGLTALKSLYLDNTRVTDLAPLQRLAALQALYLSNTRVTDLGPLQGLTALLRLSVDNTQVADLTPLQGLTALQRLDLDNTHVADLEPLKGLTALRMLFLSGTRVIDLVPLQGLTVLRELRVDASLVTVAAVAAFQEARRGLGLGAVNVVRVASGVGRAGRGQSEVP